MNNDRLAELKEKYKDRNLLEELAWGIYYDHSGYTSKQNGEFLNWLCLMAYKALKERPQGEWILSSVQVVGENWYKCSVCGRKLRTSTYHLKEYPFCHCGADMREGGENNGKDRSNISVS